MPAKANSSIWPSSSMVEHAAVNRGVVGSSPTWAAIVQTKRTLKLIRAFVGW